MATVICLTLDIVIYTFWYHFTWITVSGIFWQCYTKHYYFMYLYHYYMDIHLHHTSLFNVLALSLHKYPTRLFHVLVSPLHGYPTRLFHVLVITVTWILCNTGYCSHRFTMYTCIGYFCISVAWITALLYGLWLHRYSCILITWLFPITDIDMILLLLDMSVIDMRCAELSVT